MKKIDLGQTINSLANIGVIAGIIFLGLELNQNNDILEAQRLAALSELNGTGWKSLVDHPDLIPLLLKDREGSDLSADEEFLMNSYWMSSLYDLQSAFRLDPKRLDSTANSWATIYAVYPSFRRIWDGGDTVTVTSGRDRFDPEFVQIIDEALRAAE